jgi:hypothetical protein
MPAANETPVLQPVKDLRSRDTIAMPTGIIGVMVTSVRSMAFRVS